MKIPWDAVSDAVSDVVSPDVVLPVFERFAKDNEPTWEASLRWIKNCRWRGCVCKR